MEGEIKLIYEIGHISIIIASFLSLISIGVFAFSFIEKNSFTSLLIKNFFNLFNGALFNEQKVLTLVDVKLKIRSKSGVLTCQGDGEIFGHGKVEYSVIKSGLKYAH